MKLCKYMALCMSVYRWCVVSSGQSTLPYQVWPSDYQSDLDNRCVWSGYENEGCEQHEYSLWRHRFTCCSVEVTLRSDCLGRLNQLWIGQEGGGFWTHSTYTGYQGSAGGRQLDRWRCGQSGSWLIVQLFSVVSQQTWHVKPKPI